MRQGGFKPKGHNSGTYWVRANANSGGSKTKHSAVEETLQDQLDEFTNDTTTRWVKGTSYILGLALAIFLIYIGVTNSP